MGWILPDGRVITHPRTMLINGSTIKASAFSNPEYLASKGIYEFRESSFNQTFYISLRFTDENVNNNIIRLHEIGPRYTLDELKQIKICDVKTVAASKLSPTDWMVIRKAEVDKDVPNAILVYRNAVRIASNNIETIILEEQNDYDGLVSFSLSDLWPDPLEV